MEVFDKSDYTLIKTSNTEDLDYIGHIPGLCLYYSTDKELYHITRKLGMERKEYIIWSHSPVMYCSSNEEALEHAIKVFDHLAVYLG